MKPKSYRRNKNSTGKHRGGKTKKPILLKLLNLQPIAIIPLKFRWQCTRCSALTEYNIDGCPACGGKMNPINRLENP